MVASGVSPVPVTGGGVVGTGILFGSPAVCFGCANSQSLCAICSELNPALGSTVPNIGGNAGTAALCVTGGGVKLSVVVGPGLFNPSGFVSFAKFRSVLLESRVGNVGRVVGVGVTGFGVLNPNGFV